MNIGILKTSLKENERRVPIYPEHLLRYPEPLRKQMIFEINYGSDYGYTDDYFIKCGATLAPRDQLLTECDIVVLPKAVPEDLAKMKPHQVLFGWAHCVQQKAMTQWAIDRNLTVIAWEAMHHWNKAGDKSLHIFYKNNEIAGYAAVLQLLELLGVDGHYGPRRKVVIFGYGSVSRGSIYALHGRGFNNIHVFTRRPSHLVADQNPDVYYGQYYPATDGNVMVIRSDGTQLPLIQELTDTDIICNGILQDTNNPTMFIREHEIQKLKPRSVIIDISCDEGMGFSFARPTTFADPVFEVGNHIIYYSVDHIPTYLWNAASREISRALLPYLSIVAAGEDAWAKNAIINKSVEIQDGIIKNENILNFQKRERQYPHNIKIIKTL
jgi:alanine dehydrogenase